MAQPVKKSWQDSFACMKKNDGKGLDENPNAFTIKILQEMATNYDRSQDHWRTTAYRKAINSLRRQTRLISTKEEALSLPSVGQGLAERIAEIAQTRKLRQLDEMAADPLELVRQLFCGIHGVGLKQANIWIANGFHTLNDLREKAKLTANQQIGLDHYEDFQQRIPRAEIARHEKLLENTVSQVSPHLKAWIGGSYRRGAANSGDIDFLITAPEISKASLSTMVFKDLIPRLTELGYFKCNLTHGEGGSGSKWLGAAQLPGTALPWRRVDIIVVPEEELGAALLYWTGNDIYNRSLRLLARKKGMRLNQHGLYKDVLRGPNQQKLSQGTLVEGRDERKILAILGVPWMPPEHRNC